MKTYVTVSETYRNQYGSTYGGCTYWYSPKSSREQEYLEKTLREQGILYTVNTVEEIPESDSTDVWNQIDNVLVKDFCRFLDLILNNEDLDRDY